MTATVFDELDERRASWRQQEPGTTGASTDVCLALGDWLSRSIAPPDFLIGEWLSTTSRVIVSAATGIGKSNLMTAIAFAAASGSDFLHWKGGLPRRVLYIDGEMSRRLMRKRLADAARRAGAEPAALFVLCRDDLDEMPPLNTTAGQDFIDSIITKIGGVDLIIFDNIMSLLIGDMKEEESWSDTLPWAKQLTRRSIGQIWVHHTGHDESRSYGTSTRTWQLDTSIILERLDRPEADIAFTLRFAKARERTPDNRADFEPAEITLVNDQWQCGTASAQRSGKAPSPKALAFHGAHLDALATAGECRRESAGRASVAMTAWKSECGRLGLLDLDNPDARTQASQRAIFSKYRTELVASGWVACNGNFAWSVRA